MPSPVYVPGAVHPLLLEPSLNPLPRAPTAEDQPFAANFQAVPTFGGPAAGTGGVQGHAAARPRPLDLRVPPGKRIVAITGPNTGDRRSKRRHLHVLGICLLQATLLRTEFEHWVSLTAEQLRAQGLGLKP